MLTLVNALTAKIIPLLLSILGFGLLIVVHELGHLFFCKLFDIYVPSFSIGFGPKIFEKKIGETIYRLAQIPFGGYVEIAGQEEIAQGEQKFAHDTSDRSYAKKYFWQKVLVWLGGIGFNLIFAYLTFTALFIFSAQENNRIIVSGVTKSSPAEHSGLQGGDEILTINDIDLVSMAQTHPQDAQKTLLTVIQNNPAQSVQLTIKQHNDNSLHTISVKLGTRIDNGKEIGTLGAYFPPVIYKLPFLQAVKTGIETTNNWIFTIAQGLRNFFSQKTLEGAGGPVMIFAQGFKTAQHGFVAFFIFLAIMSINLALFNLLPLGITDGGQLLFATIECIIRRPLPQQIRIAINVISLGLFVFLAVYLTYKDIATLFGSNIKALYQKCIACFR